MMSVDEKSTKNLKMKNMIEKNFSNTMIFESINMKTSNAQTIIFHIDDSTSFTNIFISKPLLEFESFLKIENEMSTKVQTKEKNSKKKFQKRKKKFWEDNRKANR